MLNLVCFLLTLFGILILILGLVQLNHNRKGMYTISKSGESLTNKLTLLILSPESNVPCFPQWLSDHIQLVTWKAYIRPHHSVTCGLQITWQCMGTSSGNNTTFIHGGVHLHWDNGKARRGDEWETFILLMNRKVNRNEAPLFDYAQGNLQGTNDKPAQYTKNNKILKIKKTLQNHKRRTTKWGGGRIHSSSRTRLS